jgi:hypothetical protein
MAPKGIIPVIALAIAGALLAAGPAVSSADPAPTTPPAPAPPTAPPPVPVTNPSAAPAGTLLVIELGQTISSKTQHPGDMFPIRLVSAVTAGGVVLIPVGTMGVGEIVDAAPSGALGRPAKLVLAARYLEHDGVKTPLKAMKLGAAGQDKTGEVMALSFVPYVGILGAFIHGGEIEIPAGTYASAKLAAEVAAPHPAASPPAAASDKKPTATGVGP